MIKTDHLRFKTHPKKQLLQKMLACCAAASMSVSSLALDTATIVSSTLSPDCIDYKVTGICYWLFCTPWGCKVRTSIKIRHYIPDAVVSSYSNTGENPWREVALMSTPMLGADAGGDGITSQANENDLARFKNVDVIGHPGIEVFNQFLSGFDYSCEGAGTAFIPYFLSTLDTIGWRYNIPETVYPESLLPGMRDIGSMLSGNQWGSVYPRGGFMHQADDHKAGAVTAQRAGDIVTRKAQPHVYMPLLADSQTGYWPAGELKETDPSTGKWQELTPKLSQSCAVFPNNETDQEDQQGAYAWALWRPYSCCERKGQVFLGSIDF